MLTEALIQLNRKLLTYLLNSLQLIMFGYYFLKIIRLVPCIIFFLFTAE
jgi:hypothetical protein